MCGRSMSPSALRRKSSCGSSGRPDVSTGTTTSASTLKSPSTGSAPTPGSRPDQLYRPVVLYTDHWSVKVGRTRGGGGNAPVRPVAVSHPHVRSRVRAVLFDRPVHHRGARLVADARSVARVRRRPDVAVGAWGCSASLGQRHHCFPPVL